MEEPRNYIHTLGHLLQRDNKGKGKPECFYCERPFSRDADGFSNIAIDHLKSSYDGGEDNIDNYVISCKYCNSAKGKKSFKKDDDDLKKFKNTQKRVSELNDRWVEKLYKHMSLKKEINYQFYEDLLSGLANDSFFSDVKKYKKSDGYWLEWRTFDNDFWYFDLASFILQPYFLFKRINWGDSPEDGKLKDELYKNGYYCEHLMYKYIDPFDNIDFGVALIKKEIADLYEIINSKNEV